MYLRPDIISVFNDSDIICVQETWYAIQDLHMLNNLHSKFRGGGVSTTDYNEKLLSGHPPGGVAIFWHKRLDPVIKVIDLKCDWCTAVELNTGTNTVIIVNVYLPYQCAGNEDEYLEKLGYLNVVLDELNTTCYVVLGDLNANIRDTNNSMFARHLVNFCSDTNYSLSSQLLLPENSYTHVSEAWGSVSWLDHVISSTDFHDNIHNIVIDYDSTDVDHIPIAVNACIENMPTVNNLNNDGTSTRLNWEKLHDRQRSRYGILTQELLTKVRIPEAISCNDINCTVETRRDATIDFYNEILSCLKQASDTVFEQSAPSKFEIKPGWSEYVAELYKMSRATGRMWCNTGKPRQGEIDELHRSAKAKCKYAIRFIKNHANDMRRESLAKKLVDKDPKVFWKEIKLMNASKTPISSCIDGVSGVCNISELWRTHYSKLFNSIPSFLMISIQLIR